MTEQEIEKLRQLISRTDISGNQKLDWLVNFICERERALTTPDATGQSEQLVCEYCNDDAKPTCCDNCLEGMVRARA